MHRSSVSMRPGYAMFGIVLTLFLLTLAIPFSSSSPDAISLIMPDTIRIRISSIPTLDDEGRLDLSGIMINWEGNCIIGYSTGDTYEIVVDPTPGSPEIPWISMQLQLEGDIVERKMTGHFNIFTHGGSVIRTIPRATTPWEPEQEWGSWSGSGSYPDEPLRIEPMGYRRVDGVLLRSYSLWVSPFFLKVSSLGHSSDSEIELTTSDMSGPTPSRTSGDPSAVPGTLTISPNLDVTPQYLIITSEVVSEKMERLANWRNNMGIATSIVTVEDIYEQYSGSEDGADLVRTYLRDVLDTWGRLEHVLMAGDWDTVPTKRVHDSDAYGGWDDGFIPADSYFQCLDGSWDLDGDGLYSEPGDMEDIIPDLSVSRLAINDPQIWEEKISQIIDYERGLSSLDWTSRALLVAANTHNYGDGNTHSEYLWNKYLNDTYDEKIPLYEDEGQLTLQAIDDSLKEGVSFVQFVDHGGPTVWCDDYGAGVVYRDKDARELTNSEMMPVISTLACLTTWFDDTSGCQYQRFSEGLGEVFTENPNGGALGYIGSSRTSVGILGANRYLPYDNGLQEDIARQVGGIREFTLGNAFTGAKEHYAEVWGNQFSNVNNKEVSLCWLEFTLLGEPAVDFWTGENGNMYLDVYHEDDLDPHIQILVKDEEGYPLPDANVTLQNFERGVFQRISTDEDGWAIFDLTLDWFCDINLTVTKHNFQPRRDYVRISDIIPPITTMVTDPAFGDGENGWFLSEPIVSLVPNEKADVHYRIGNGPNAILNSSVNYTLPALGEGVHQLHFFGEDEAGNLEGEVHMDVKIDLHAPNISALISPEEPDGENDWYGTEPLVTIEVMDNDKGAPVDIHYEIDGEEFVYMGPFLVPEGIHTIRSWGIDRAGRWSETGSMELRVDTTPPRTMAQLSIGSPDGKNGWFKTSPLVTLESTEEMARIEYRFSTRDDFISYTDPFHITDGNHLLQYRSIDRSGNIGETLTIPLKIDTEEPVVNCRVTPVEPDGSEGFYITSPTLRMDWYDNLGSTLFFSIDGGEWQTDITRYDMIDGEHEVLFYAEDEAGNRCEVERMSFKVDTIVPVTSFDVKDPGANGWYTKRPLIELSTDIDAQVTYWWEGRGEINTFVRPIDVPGQEGTFRLFARATDRAGNEEYERSMLFRVDTRAPILRIDTMEQSRGEFLIDFSDSTDGTDLQFRVLKGGKTIVDWTSDPNLIVYLSDGDHTITVETRDEAGNIASTDLDLAVDPPLTSYLLIIGPVVILAIVIAVGVILFLRRGNKHHRPEYYEQYPSMNQQLMEPIEAREL